jgi:hypothetical protein
MVSKAHAALIRPRVNDLHARLTQIIDNGFFLIVPTAEKSQYATGEALCYGHAERQPKPPVANVTERRASKVRPTPRAVALLVRLVD